MGVAWIVLERDVDLNDVGEGSKRWNGGGRLGQFAVVYVQKKGGHSHDVCHVVATVGIGPSIDEGYAIVGME